MVLKNFGKRMAKGRTEGHVLAPRCGQCHLQPSPPGASIVFPGSQRQQFFHHSDGKRQRTLKITLDTRQRHLKASQCHQVVFCSESSKSSSSQAHCTLQENPWCWEHVPEPGQGGQSGCKRKFGEIWGCFCFGPGNTGVMQTPDCASLIIYSVTQDKLTGKQRILQG